MSRKRSQPVERISVNQADAARMVGVTARTIRNWEKDKLIVGTKVKGVRLYPVVKLRELAGAGNGVSH